MKKKTRYLITKVEQARVLYKRGELSYCKAINAIKPYIDKVNVKSKELAKNYKQRSRLVKIKST